MNSGAASGRECDDPPETGAASKHASEDSGEEPPREKRHASMAASGDDVSRTDEDGRSRLHHAAILGEVERARELIRRGADTRLRDRQGYTPLHRALYRSGREAIAELLAEADCSNDVQDRDGKAPLHLAAANGYVKTIRKLLADGSRTRVQDKWGRTPLHWALVWRKEAAAELLAEEDCSNDVCDQRGSTPLHLAAEKAFLGVVRTLVRSGMNPHVKDSSGQYPILLALEHRRNETIPKMILSLYALKGIAIDREELRLGEKELLFCIEELSRCDAEIRLMRRTQVPASSVSYLDLVTRHITRVAARLLVEGAKEVSRSDLARQKFPVYADLIASRLRAVGQRWVRADRCLECFSLLSPPLPPTCTDVILLCLIDGDMENFVRAVRLEFRP